MAAFGTAMSGCGRNGLADYSVYYVNTSGTALVPISASVEAGADVNDKIHQLLDEMNTSQKRSEYNAAKPKDVAIENVSIDGNIVYIYFTEAYNKMEPAVEVLYRAAVVKTLTQPDEIDYVAFYVAGAPATYANGNVIGMMSADDFVDNSNDGARDLKWCDLKLYFANAKGDKLLPAAVSVAYNKNVPIERVIVEQLIAGPGAQEYYRTLPDNLRLLGISITDGVCYVNFDASFLNGMVNAADMISIYSIVNSLCELDTVNQVQILVNGEANRMYRESVSLERRFSANADIVQTASSTQTETQMPTQPAAIP